MIELFAKCPDFLKGREGIDVAPIHVDENISSLSAILLDDAYYSLFLQGIRTVDGVSVWVRNTLSRSKRRRIST